MLITLYSVKEARAAYARLLKNGWTDAVRYLHPEERIYTFWDYLYRAWERNAGPQAGSFSIE